MVIGKTFFVLIQCITRLGTSANILIVTDGLNTGWAKTANTVIEEIQALGTGSVVQTLGLVPYSQLLHSWRFKVNKENSSFVSKGYT